MGIGVVIAVAVAGFGLVALVAVLAVLAARKRQQAFQTFARSQGWTWTARDDGWVRRWRGAPFGTGDARQARNIVTGSWHGRPVVAFDYSYQTSNTDGQGQRTTTAHRFGVCAIGIGTAVPRLEATHAGLLTRVGRALGAATVELESEQFNRTFRVTCPDPKFASDVLHPRTMQLLLDHAGPGHLAWRMEGSDLLCWDGGAHSPSQVLERLTLLEAVLDGVPSFVWRDRGVAPERSGESAS